MATIPGPHILIVDDDALARAFLRDSLADKGYRIREASDGEEALSAVAAEKPAVVLLDLFMPRKSGLEVLRELSVLSPESKVLVISGLETESLIEEALKGGALGFIGKPFHPIEINDAVTSVLKA